MNFLCKAISSSFIFILSCGSFTYGDSDIHWVSKMTGSIDKEWQRKDFINQTRFQNGKLGGISAIIATGQNSSSGLYKEVDIRLNDYPVMEWSWAVETVQPSADLLIIEKEDYALSIFLIFTKFWKTRVITYAWSSNNHTPGEIVYGPRYPIFILRTGDSKNGLWISEKRNVFEDYKTIYGEYPDMKLAAIALFTDNDQTLEPVKVYYGPIKMLVR